METKMTMRMVNDTLMKLLTVAFFSTVLFFISSSPTTTHGFLIPPSSRTMKMRTRRTTGTTVNTQTSTMLMEMKRPILDQIASTLFRLENDRVAKSSVIDEKGRVGEPMEWSESSSVANKFSKIIAENSFSSSFKQWVADIIAGEYDEVMTREKVDTFVASYPVAMYSFTTCPFCRRAKDFLNENSIDYRCIELDELNDNEGNEIRATLGKKTGRTSVPSIFINGEFIGGCNDGPGLLPLAESGQLDEMLKS